MKKYLVFILALYVAVSCSKDSEPIVHDYSKRTIIAYLAADNNLYYNAIQDINEMEAGWRPEFGRLLVYLDSRATPNNPKIYLIQHDNTSQIVSPVTKEYKRQNSASSATLEQVIDDCMSMYPSDSYGLILWSHGTGWLPQGALALQSGLFGIQSASVERQSLVKSFGADNGREIEIKDLVASLPSVKFDFIMFDACFMGGIEVVYELRNNAKYIIASAAEILTSGFPYDKVMEALYAKETNYSPVAQIYFNHYNSLDGSSRSATIAVTKTDELDSLANVTRKVVENSYMNLASLDRREVQSFDAYTRTLFYDFGDFIGHLSKDRNTEFEQQLNKTVMFKAHTPMFMDNYEIKTHSGYNAYIPYNNSLNEAYKSFSWYNVSGMSLLIP